MKVKAKYNIVLKSRNIKFSNKLKNNVQLGDEFDGAKGTKLHKNKENIEHKAACLSQLTNRGLTIPLE